MVDTRDAQLVLVGSECFKRVQTAGNNGYQPPKGGPRLFPITCQCPQECDCENPEPESGVALVSNLCPIHNWNPYPAYNCPIHSNAVTQIEG